MLRSVLCHFLAVLLTSPFHIVFILTLDQTLYFVHLHQPENSVSCFHFGQSYVLLLPTPAWLKKMKASSIPTTLVTGRLKCRWQWIWFCQKIHVSVQYLPPFRHKRITQSLGVCSQAAPMEVLAHWELQACSKDWSHLRRLSVSIHIYLHKLNCTPYLKKISCFLGHFPN